MQSADPLCRQCAKSIPKATTRVWLEIKPGDYRNTSLSRHIVVDRYPTTIEECRRLTNLKVVAVRKRGDGTIQSFFEWDGLSYVGRFFCSGDHARLFGYLAAERGFATNTYNKAMENRMNAALPTLTCHYRAVASKPVDGKPSWHAEFLPKSGTYMKVCSQYGPIEYESYEAALSQARSAAEAYSHSI